MIYPPVAIDRFPFVSQKQDYYLVVSRLVGYKQVGLIVDAFNQLGLPLLVIGEGIDRPMLERMAKKNIQFLGWRSNEEVATYMSQARAFVYAAYEDFGIAPVEAQACGTPVIAYGKGGTSETVKDVRSWADRGTGILFETQQVSDIVVAVRAFEAIASQINPEVIASHAQQFSAETFKLRYQQAIDRVCEKTGIGTKNK